VHFVRQSDVLSIAICLVILMSFTEHLYLQPSRFGIGAFLLLCTEIISTNYATNLKECRKKSTGIKQNGISDLISHAYRYRYAFIKKYTTLLIVVFFMFTGLQLLIGAKLYSRMP